MRKLIFGKILRILLALIGVALSASGAVACTGNNYATDDAYDACNNGCDTLGACGNAWGEYGNSIGAYGDAFSECGACCKEAKEPTWKELVIDFQNGGFESWLGINFAGLLNL